MVDGLNPSHLKQSGTFSHFSEILKSINGERISAFFLRFPTHIHVLIIIVTELKLVFIKEAERLLQCSRGSDYEHRDKASQLLAHQLHCQAASHLITSVKNTNV